MECGSAFATGLIGGIVYQGGGVLGGGKTAVWAEILILCNCMPLLTTSYHFIHVNQWAGVVGGLVLGEHLEVRCRKGL